MTLSSYELIEINAVVIIGLTIFLSFQSITSSFIENDFNSFYTKYRDADIEINTTKNMLEVCQNTYTGKTGRAKIAVELAPIPQGATSIIDEAIKEIKNNCGKYAEEHLRAKALLDNIEGYGIDAEYFDKDGATDWFEQVASGPLKVIYVNLIMVVPFAISAVFELIYSTTKEAGNQASKLGTAISIAGFFVLVAGFITIGFFFYTYNQVFLN